MLAASALLAGEPETVQPLVTAPLHACRAYLPEDTDLLVEPAALERFLISLDGGPPDWAEVYGQGHHDPLHDERLFALNRQRDEARRGRAALHRRIAFVWTGELSAWDEEAKGFRVALGPTVTATSWGIVRFKYDDLPGNLVAIPSAEQQPVLMDRLRQGKPVEIDVVMAGILVPDESLVYDFSHDQDGQGLIMPVVHVERLVYRLRS